MIRLSKLMAERGLCSRREADRYIERGLVFVNGEQITELGTKVPLDAQIELASEAELEQGRQLTVLLNKPLGYVSSQAEEGYEPAKVLLTPERRDPRDRGPMINPSKVAKLAVAGRLDINSSGLLVFTQDGRIAKQLVGDQGEVEKEYLVSIKGEASDEIIARLCEGLELDGKRLRRARVTRAGRDRLRFVLREGRKRQIRRMCDLVGLEVVGLKRVRIGAVELGDLPVGQWRLLRPKEKF